jgi:hypothetical protein
MLVRFGIGGGGMLLFMEAWGAEELGGDENEKG